MRYLTDEIMSQLISFSHGKVDIFCATGKLCTKQRWTKYVQNEYIWSVQKSFLEIGPIVGPPQKIMTYKILWIVPHKSAYSNETDLSRRIWLKRVKSNAKKD